MAVVSSAPVAPKTVAAPPVASGLAVFDLDRTLIPGSSLALFGRAATTAGLVQRRHVARYTVAEVSFRRRGLRDGAVTRVADNLLRLASGHRHDVLLDLATTVGPALVDSVRPGARLMLEQHRRSGDLVAIVSASPEALVAVVARGIGADIAIGTQIEVDDGVLTGRFASPMCYGGEKVRRLHETFDDLLDRTVTAYADSASDAALLATADHPVAVNADRRLAALAARRGWASIRW